MNTNTNSGYTLAQFLGGTRAVHEDFTRVGTTPADTQLKFRLQLNTQAGGEAWKDATLKTIEDAKSGTDSIQILGVDKTTWDAHASAAPEAIAAVDLFLKNHPSYSKVPNGLNLTLGFIDLFGTAGNIRTDFDVDVDNVQHKANPHVILTQRIGAFGKNRNGLLPPELEGHVKGIHLSTTPAARSMHQILTGSVQKIGNRKTRRAISSITSHHQIKTPAGIGSHAAAGKVPGLTVLETKKIFHGVSGAGKVQVGIGFGPNTSASIADQIFQAAVLGYKFISWSWGLRERGWTAADRALVAAAIDFATAMGCVVGFASGDTGANDGGDSPDLDFAGSYFRTLCYGGTFWNGNTNTYWNRNADSSAGGFGTSTNYKAPYQGGGFRVGPDVSGPADPNSGFGVFAQGQTAQIGGTSDIPWLMMEIAKLSAKLGVPVGFIQPWLYAQVKLDSSLMTPVLTDSGDVDVRCGLGTPVFQAWFDNLQKLLAAGKDKAIPEGFIVPTFGPMGPAMFIGELGGGFFQADIDTFCDMIGAPRFNINVHLIDGGANTWDTLNGASGEVYLDLCCSARANDVN